MDNILVVGSYAVAMFIKTPRMPIFGETLIGSEFFMGPGGKGSNQAIAISRLGGKVSFICFVGNDSLGDEALNLFKKEKINTELIKRTKKSTGVGFVILNDDSMEKIVPGFVREINFKTTPQYSKGTVQVRFWGKDQNHTDFTDKNNVLPQNIFYGFGCQVLVWESVSDQRHNAVSKGSRWSPSRDIIGDIRINSLPSQK